MTVGGFPEPFLDGDERAARRWRRERFDRVLREDIPGSGAGSKYPVARDVSGCTAQSALEVLITLLPTLAGDIQISPKTAKVLA